MVDTPLGIVITDAAKYVHRWIDVLDTFGMHGSRAARLKAEKIVWEDASNDVLEEICKQTKHSDEFTINAGTMPWWRFWDRTLYDMIDCCDTKAGILMAKKYVHYMKTRNGPVDGTANLGRWLEKFPNGITLDYMTHELVAIVPDLKDTPSYLSRGKEDVYRGGVLDKP